MDNQEPLHPQKIQMVEDEHFRNRPFLLYIVLALVLALSTMAMLAGFGARSASEAAEDAAQAVEEAARAEAERAASREEVNEALRIALENQEKATNRAECITVLEAQFDIYVVEYLAANADEDLVSAQQVIDQALPFMQQYQALLQENCFVEDPDPSPLAD